MVVDDDLLIHEFVALGLDNLGIYNVIKAASGEQALGFLDDPAHQIDVIFCDLNMPQMAGGVMTARLREDEKTATIPVIYLTGVVSKDEAELTDHKLAGYQLLAKPFDRSELLAMVGKLLPE